MLVIILKCFFACFGVAFGMFAAAGILSVLTDRPDRIRQLRAEGYDSCINDILNYNQYWDRSKSKYVDVEIKEVEYEHKN